MNLEKIHKVYFLGIGGIGMSALARFFLQKKCSVYGYDKTKTVLTEQLQNEGAIIHYNEDVNFVQKNSFDLIIYTPAIPKTHKEYTYFSNNNFKIYKRSEVLGIISKNYFTIAIAGTHGKTTTSTMVAHILNQSNKKCVAFLGGISLNFNSNLLVNPNAEYLVVEADEYDRSFLTLSPDIALITSIDADHLDVYGDSNAMEVSYNEFVGKIRKTGTLISKPAIINKLNKTNKTVTYAINNNADYKGEDIKVENGNYIVNINNEQVITLGLAGIHNVENAVGAFAIANQIGLDNNEISKSLSNFKGVERRFEYVIKTDNCVFIDDYAHHPEEIKSTVLSAKQLYPNKKITGIFQPHLYSRTRDFAQEFAQSLSLLDELILLDIYPARELPIEGVNAELILKKVSCKKTLSTKAKLLDVIKANNFEVLITMGAGDISTLVKPIKKVLKNE